ncbi:hypothetical protein [Stenotrophomonas sp. Iso1]|uniref:hypothetical protein n=1 Tax=Stenotrophomonas sp. Iso1 TaxID=2977283 RepID=UPI0022B786D8|nr:hypothetical protein [Stenotrophomonas sp. Iso1]
MNQAVLEKTSKPAPPPVKHHLCFRLVDLQNNPIRDRRYTLEWTDVGALAPSRREGTSGADGRTIKITTQGQVAVSLAIAPPVGGQCRPVGQSVQSKPDNKLHVVTVRLTFNATVTTAPQSRNHCETLTLRQGKQRVKYVINNVLTVRNGGEDHPTYLTNLPYLIVDVATLEVLHGGQSAGEPAKFFGSRTQVSTVEVPVDGVSEVGIVLGAAAHGGAENWRRNARSLVMYRVVPEAEGLTAVIIKEVSGVPSDSPIEHLICTDGEGRQRTAVLNGKVWAAITRSYSMADIRTWIGGNLTLPKQGGNLSSWYQVARPSLRQIDWAEQHGKISAQQAAHYREALASSSSAQTTELPLRMQLAWSELLEPFYSGQIVNIPAPTRKHSQGGEIIIAPLDLTLKLQVGFCDNAGEFTETPQADVIAKNHPYIYMMLLSACAEAGVSFVEISGMWRPMLGSYLHKLGDALDIVAVDAVNDQLEKFNFKNSRVSSNALAKRFSTLLYEHRYANSAQHIYKFDEYPHGSDGRHWNHLHITCMSRKPLDERDMAGYIAPHEIGSLTPPPVFPEMDHRGVERPWLVR